LREALRLRRSYLEQRPNDIIAWEAFLNVATSLEDLESVHEALEVLRKAGLTRPEAANYFMDYAYQHLAPDDGAEYGLAAMERWPLANIIYQTHRNLLFAGRVEEAAAAARVYEQRFPLHPLMEARQACAEGRPERLHEIVDFYRSQDVNANTGNPLWLVLKMLGEEEQAVAVLRHFEFPDAPYVIANWLSYKSFDPSPFPALVAVLERENVQRPPTKELPYACTRAAKGL
jgi:hypothetical protein